MFVLKISRSNLKLGISGQKLGHWAKSKENLVNTLEVTVLKLLNEWQTVWGPYQMSCSAASALGLHSLLRPVPTLKVTMIGCVGCNDIKRSLLLK